MDRVDEKGDFWLLFVDNCDIMKMTYGYLTIVYREESGSMNITFMIGNGFDLNLGLHTKYNDFLEVYTIPKSTDDEVLADFKSTILQKRDLWSFAEKAFGEYTSDFDGKQRTVDNYCDCHENFCDELALYLEREETFVDLSADGIGKTFVNAIKGFTDGFRTEQKTQIETYVKGISGGFRYNFVSFNYTMELHFKAIFGE